MVFDQRLSLVAGMLQRFTWERVDTSPTSARIELGGRITIEDAAALWKRISATLTHVEGLQNVEVELSQIVLIDGACMCTLGAGFARICVAAEWVASSGAAAKRSAASSICTEAAGRHATRARNADR